MQKLQSINNHLDLIKTNGTKENCTTKNESLKETIKQKIENPLHEKKIAPYLYIKFSIYSKRLIFLLKNANKALIQ